MAYKQNWVSSEEMTDSDIIKYFNDLAVDYTDNKFYVRFETDDGGKHVVISSEESAEGGRPWKGDFSAVDCKGWRVMRMTVPFGYIDTFMNKK
jgi:hypothetical protein